MKSSREPDVVALPESGHADLELEKLRRGMDEATRNVIAVAALQQQLQLELAVEALDFINA